LIIANGKRIQWDFDEEGKNFRRGDFIPVTVFSEDFFGIGFFEVVNK